jgi:hypothetical protein
MPSRNLTLLLAALAASFALSFFTACDKEPEDGDTLKPKYNYFPLEVGNYWVFKVDTILFGQKYNYQDTIAVLEKKVFEKETTFVVKNPFFFKYFSGIEPDLWYLYYGQDEILYTYGFYPASTGTFDTTCIRTILISFKSPEYEYTYSEPFYGLYVSEFSVFARKSFNQSETKQIDFEYFEAYLSITYQPHKGPSLLHICH